MSKRKTPTVPAAMGPYQLGLRMVSLRVDPASGDGSADMLGDDRTVLTVGLAGHWHEAIDVLLHEAMEVAMNDLALTYRPSPDISSSADNYLFVFTHPQFAELVARVGLFVANALPDLRKAWETANAAAKT